MIIKVCFPILHLTTESTLTIVYNIFIIQNKVFPSYILVGYERVL